MPNTRVVRSLYKKHIKGTAEKAMVVNVVAFICHLTLAVSKEIGMEGVYINTRVLKHIFDKKPAEEFEFIVDYLHEIIEYPEHIYKNKDPKRGHYAFTKTIKGDNYFCSLERDGEMLCVVTAFRIRKNSYLNSYELLWSWRGDISSS